MDVRRRFDGEEMKMKVDFSSSDVHSKRHSRFSGRNVSLVFTFGIPLAPGMRSAQTQTIRLHAARVATRHQAVGGERRRSSVDANAELRVSSVRARA